MRFSMQALSDMGKKTGRAYSERDDFFNNEEQMYLKRYGRRFGRRRIFTPSGRYGNIKMVLEKYDGTADFCVIPEFYTSNTPALIFNRKFLEIVSYFNATIQIDMYALDNNELNWLIYLYDNLVRNKNSIPNMRKQNKNEKNMVKFIQVKQQPL